MNKVLLERHEAEAIYRALIEMNNVSCSSFTIAIRRDDKEGFVFNWNEYSRTTQPDLPDIMIYSVLVSPEYSLVPISYVPGARMEHHANQAAFAEAYQL